MKLRWLFFALVALLVALTALLLFLSSHDASVYFYVAEGAVVVSILFLCFFYRSIVQPIVALTNGVEMLKSQELNQRLRPVGQTEADSIAAMFNMLLDRLHEERLRNIEQEHFLNLIINNSPTAIILLDGNGRVAMTNRSAVGLLGDVTGMRISEIVHSLGRVMSETAIGERVTSRPPDGKVYRVIHETFMDSGYAHHFYLIDELTGEVARAERKAYEKIIRMMAHEVNNTLAGIMATMSVIAEMSAEDDSLAELAEPADACLERTKMLSGFVNRFAEVVKLPDPVKDRVSITQIAKSAVAFCSREALKRNIEVKVAGLGDVVVSADRQLIEQVFVNILKNAFESIETDGEVTIDVDQSRVTVTDNGRGISREAADNIFSPFFSTKPGGHGIGLMMTAEILKKHGFAFSLETGSDKLTRFVIDFVDKRPQ